MFTLKDEAWVLYFVLKNIVLKESLRMIKGEAFNTEFTKFKKLNETIWGTKALRFANFVTKR
ncbi:hypothetical protein CW304_05390 [Bacillus sp. UFRGS-B20]|nr:hypothetical protein CW304_05390 [Bacillus sp. UFRGS-B20]